MKTTANGQATAQKASIYDIVENFYNNSENTDTVARTIAESISRAVTTYYGKGSTAKHLLDAISYHVQSFCNPALNDSDDDK